MWSGDEAAWHPVKMDGHYNLLGCLSYVIITSHNVPRTAVRLVHIIVS